MWVVAGQWQWSVAEVESIESWDMLGAILIFENQMIINSSLHGAAAGVAG